MSDFVDLLRRQEDGGGDNGIGWRLTGDGTVDGCMDDRWRRLVSLIKDTIPGMMVVTAKLTGQTAVKTQGRSENGEWFILSVTIDG